MRFAELLIVRRPYETARSSVDTARNLAMSVGMTATGQAHMRGRIVKRNHDPPPTVGPFCE